MALILNIDTATETASVCLSFNGEPLALLQNENQKEHASFVHAAVDNVLSKAAKHLHDIEAFAVASGPGSYTGLRVGMATAKGFCYALAKPLITINTLQSMAKAALKTITGSEDNYLLCPMIDARRMEVFTALFDKDLRQIMPTKSAILEAKMFESYMANNKILFFGSGGEKFRQIETHPNAVFLTLSYSAEHLGYLAEVCFQQKNFSDISYSQPNYFKEFYSAAKS